MDHFEPLQKDLETYLSPEQIDQIHQAYLVAEEAHKDQKRQSGEPYITHPVAVAQILAGLRLDPQGIMAALMHDVIEDSLIDKFALAKQFGQEVADLVDGVSKLDQLKFENRQEAQAQSFRKMLLAMVKDIRVILIKLADRLHNMRTLGACVPEKRRRVARETLEIYAPIANRLGMNNFYIEFEDRGFEMLYPMRYHVIKASVKKAKGNRKEIITQIKQALKEALTKRGIPYISILGRKKHLYSIYRKMEQKHISFSEIMDVYGFRIVVEDIDTCYRTLGVIHQLYKPVLDRFKDYIAIPKINSYQSIHTTLFGPYGVPIEIQIRTKEMHEVADTGIAAHWLYKTPGQSPDQAQFKARQWLQNLMEIQESTKSPIEFIENVKNNLFPHEVYVFTPKGDIFELPANATAVDFAYAIHTDIGNTCIAVKINRRVAPLSTQLHNGQTVEVITAPGARPSPSWLNFVATSRARANIRDYIKSQRRSESIQFGKELLDKTLASFNAVFDQFSDVRKENIIKRLHFKSWNDLLEAIGLGNQLPIVVARHLLEHLKEEEAHELVRSSRKEPILIKGSHGMVVAFATCCQPIPGDPIIGVFNPGKGLEIHASQCVHIAKLCKNPDSCIDVQWEENIKGEFQVDVTVEVINEKGVLAKLANAIALAESNIDDIRVDPHEGRYNIIKLTISVHNRDHLAQVLRRIRTLDVVNRVSRFH